MILEVVYRADTFDVLQKFRINLHQHGFVFVKSSIVQ